MKQQIASFTKSELDELSSSSRLTFRPMGRNRLACIQVRRLKNLSSRKVKSLRGQLAGYIKFQNAKRFENSTPRARQEDLLIARINFDNDVRCPHCISWQYGYYRSNTVYACRNCNKSFRTL